VGSITCRNKDWRRLSMLRLSQTASERSA
jgi:hypothetical protein